MRTVGAIGIRGFEKLKVLWLEGNAAPPLTVGIAGVGSLSALAALCTMSEAIIAEPVGMAVTRALVFETIAVP